LSSRNLERLAKRSYISFGNVGGFSSNGSGDYSIAFSTNPAVRVPYNNKNQIEIDVKDVHNDELSALFMAVWEATEEALLNSMFIAEDMTRINNRTVKALTIKETLEIFKKYNALNHDKLPKAISK